MTEEKKLRSGFTTGTCAAAAAKAAAQILFSGRKRTRVSVMTPAGQKADFTVEEITAEEIAAEENAAEEIAAEENAAEEIAVEYIAAEERAGEKYAVPANAGDCGAVPRPVRRHRFRTVRCAVQKDAGDDPDVTNGAFVYAGVSRVRELPPVGPFYECPWELPLYITGGAGIGVVTKDGLSCPKGFFAINPVPRRMIFSEVSSVIKDRGEEGECAGADMQGVLLEPGEKILIEISIPEGERLAGSTFNPNLGIVGGISVLGTSGIVNPMSEKALLETIRLDIRVRAAQGRRVLAVAPGNYGEAFLKGRLGLAMDSFVKCSNFAGETFCMMREEGIEKALFAGHLGKLVKVAGGVLNTHSRYGDRRMEILADCAAEAGAGFAVREALLNKNTTEEAAEFLRDCGCLDSVMKIAAGRVKQTLEVHSGIAVEAVLFTENCGILAMTEGAAKLAEELVCGDAAEL